MSIIGIYNGGKTTIPFNGQNFTIGLVIIRVSENESAPIDYIAYQNLPFVNQEFLDLRFSFFNSIQKIMENNNTANFIEASNDESNASK